MHLISKSARVSRCIIPAQLLTCFIRPALVASLLFPFTTAHAHERLFTYSQEVEMLPKHRWEFEQWLTYRKGFPDNDRGYASHLWDFREELEYGLTDRLSTSLYLNFRDTEIRARQAGLTDSHDFAFRGVSGELKYQLLNPNTQPIGLAVYFEPTFNSGDYELEEKILLQRNLGEHWVTVLNITTEQEWEREDGVTKRESVFEGTFGLAHRLNAHWSLGLEARYHAVYRGLGFNDHLGTGWFAGPNVHYGSSRWWATLTVLPQWGGNPASGRLNFTEHQTFETRLIVGVSF